MPIFEYRCKQCDREFELLIWSKGDGEDVECPQCSSREVERTLSCFSTAKGLGSLSASNCGTSSSGFK